MFRFKLKSNFSPAGDQPQAIDKLTAGLKSGLSDQVLLGVTGSGKTFTLACVIEKINRPTLIISHNKTLAAQLYQEFRDFFPQNAVSYFVSYYDYYQPEAYLPQTDTYIEKETEINEEIDKLRLAATTNLLTRRDTIIVASVSCIYNIGSPKEYGNFTLDLRQGLILSRQSIFTRLIELQYERADFSFHRGTFRVRGEYIDLFPAYEDKAVRIYHDGTKINKLQKIDPLTGDIIAQEVGYIVYPAKHYMTNPSSHPQVFGQIRTDLAKRVAELKKQNKLIEAQRINQRVNYDLEMIESIGYVNGIENYSRYFDSRNPGDPPYTLLDYYSQPYANDWLLVIDESHMTIPQVRGMYNGDRSRKQTLIDFGFRLPAAIDNRPLRFTEFLTRMPQTIFVSATPAPWEIQRAKEAAQGQPKVHTGIVEQIIRPTGLVDPEIVVKDSTNQVQDLLEEIKKNITAKERTLVITLTKRTAEDLSEFLKEKNINVHYLHSDIITLERSDILDALRQGKFDVIVGINLLREGLDLPEVSLVAILDADKEGFLRSDTALIQTMGRAARNVSGAIILYAQKVTDSMKRAISEVERRKKIQMEYNRKHNITPKSIHKPIRKRLVELEVKEDDITQTPLKIDNTTLLPSDRQKVIKKLTQLMKQSALELDFEYAARLRDKISSLTSLS